MVYNYDRRTPVQRLANEVDVGFTWPSVRGERRIVERKDFNGRDVFLVTTGDSRSAEIISASEIQSDIRIDTKNFESRSRAIQEKNEDEANTRQHNSWLGYTDKLAPLARARAIEALGTEVRRGGRSIARGDLMVELVNKGWRVRVDPKKGRMIEDPETLTYLLQKDVSKIALDFAEFLQR